MELLQKQFHHCWSGKYRAQYNIYTFLRSFYTSVTAAPPVPSTLTYLKFLFSESSGNNLLLKCSRPSSLSTSPCFALCFWTCILKRQYFFCEVPFESGAQKESDFLFFCSFFIFSTVICDTAAWIITCGSTVWLSENIMKLVLPFLPCFLLQCACLFNLWNWQEHNNKIPFYA